MPKGKVVSFAIGLLLVAAIGWYLAQRRETLATLGAVSIWSIIPLLALALLSGLANALQFRQATLAVGLRLEFKEWYGLTVVNTMLNYVVPLKGAVVLRAAYMKQRYQLSYASYASVTAVTQIITVGMAGLIGCFAILAASSLEHEKELLLLAILAVVASAGVYVVVSLLDAGQVERLGGWFKKFAAGFSYWRQDGRASVSFLVIAALWLLMQGARLWFVFEALGVPVKFPVVLAIQALASISALVAITPGNLGLKEGVTALLASLAGVDPALALLASLLDRAAGVAVVVPLGLAFSRILYRKQLEPMIEGGIRKG